MEERIARVLSADEKVLWVGKPELGEFLDKDNRKSAFRWMIGISIFFAAIFIAYILVFILAGQTPPLLLGFVIVFICGVVVTDPYTTYRQLHKTVYAVTDKRVIVCSTDSSEFDLPIEKVDSVKKVVGQDGRSSLLLCSAIAEQGSVGKLRKGGLTGMHCKKSEDLTKYPIFYNIPDADKVAALFSKSAE